RSEAVGPLAAWRVLSRKRPKRLIPRRQQVALGEGGAHDGLGLLEGPPVDPLLPQPLLGRRRRGADRRQQDEAAGGGRRGGWLGQPAFRLGEDPRGVRGAALGWRPGPRAAGGRRPPPAPDVVPFIVAPRPPR